jgi:DNA-binding MarR family transcriptional regulator
VQIRVITAMQADLHQLERYINDDLGVAVKTTAWPGRKHLPHFLKELYDFAEMDLLGRHFLLVIDATPAEQSPAALRKHMDLIQTKQKDDVVYVRTRMTAFNRKRLIDHKVPFIVPGNQMYLPMLAIDLREHFRSLRAETSQLSPSTQAVIIYTLVRKIEVRTPLEMAQTLGYSAMSMTRAFDELEATNLAEVTVRGRERCIRFTAHSQELWNKAQPFLRSPVNKRLFVRRTEAGANALCAGLSALAQYSMLASPPGSTYALSRGDWKSLKEEHHPILVPTHDSDTDEIEIWSYAPALFADRNLVDQLSLYLSLKANRDERVEASLEEMMRNFAW